MPALLLPMHAHIFADRGLLILALFLVAYLIACGVNRLFELFSGLQGRRPRTMESQCVYVQKDRNPARPAPGLGLQPVRRPGDWSRAGNSQQRDSGRAPALPPEHQPQRLRARRAFLAPALR